MARAAFDFVVEQADSGIEPRRRCECTVSTSSARGPAANLVANSHGVAVARAGRQRPVVAASTITRKDGPTFTDAQDAEARFGRWLPIVPLQMGPVRGHRVPRVSSGLARQMATCAEGDAPRAAAQHTVMLLSADAVCGRAIGMTGRAGQSAVDQRQVGRDRNGRLNPCRVREKRLLDLVA